MKSLSPLASKKNKKKIAHVRKNNLKEWKWERECIPEKEWEGWSGVGGEKRVWDLGRNEDDGDVREINVLCV